MLASQATRCLVGRLFTQNFMGCPSALCREIYLARRMKSDNEEIYDVVDSIHSAVRQQKQISFFYYEFDMDKKRVLRNGGERYQFSPYGMFRENQVKACDAVANAISFTRKDPA